MNRRELIAFAVLFVAYQLPEGVGQRLLHSFTAQAVLLVMFFFIAYGVGRRLRGSALETYALDEPWAQINQLAIAGALAIGAKAIGLWIGAALGIYAVVSIAIPGAQRLAVAITAALAMTFFPSLAEDIVTRGFWFRLRRVRWTPWTFLLASSVIYVANHIYRLVLGPLEWLMLFAFGCAYAAALIRTGSLWAAVGLHWGWNFANALQDGVVTTIVQSPNGSRLLSAAIHVVLFVFVWNYVPVAPRRRGLS